MANIFWYWPGDRPFTELTVDFTIHNDVDLADGKNGLYFMIGHADISDVPFYFGLQTDVYAPDPPHHRGKAAIFSRWKTRDLGNARWHEQDGFSQSAGYEGDFIGVRRLYDWGAGDYRARLGPDGKDDDGQWYSVWITDKAAGVETWIGSLRFPFIGGRAAITEPSYSTLEVYGNAIRPIDIPEWHVTIERPLADGRRSHGAHLDIAAFYDEITNADVRYDRRADVVHLRVGGLTDRTGQIGHLRFR